MAEPDLTFMYNTSQNDLPYTGIGGPDGSWREVLTGFSGDVKVYTGGGINGYLPNSTMPVGSRDATLRPTSGTYVIPQIYIETSSSMYEVPLASGNPNTNRYVFGVYINGTIVSDMYLEMWDDDTYTTTNLPSLSGTSSYPNSMFNAIRTTTASPPAGWSGTTTSGANVIAGYDNRLRLKGSDYIENEAVYFNMYCRLAYDAPLFHDQPIEAYRYLYV